MGPEQSGAAIRQIKYSAGRIKFADGSRSSGMRTCDRGMPEGGRHAFRRDMEACCRRSPPPAPSSCRSRLTAGAAQAQDKTYVMKVTTPTINDGPHLLAKNFAAAVERDSGGRIKAEVYPASQLGSIPRQIEGVQFGAIQAAVIPPEFFVGVDERFEVMAAPGLVNSVEHGQRLAADPAVLETDARGLAPTRGCTASGCSSRSRILHRFENADPPSCRLQGQEDPDLRIRLPVRGDEAARRDAGGDDARRRPAGAAAGRHRRRDCRHHSVFRISLSGRREIRHRDQSAGRSS